MSRTKVTRKPKEGFFCPVYSDSMLLQEGNIVLKIATILKHKVFFAGIVNGTLEMELSLLWDVSMMLWCWVLMEKNHLSISRPWMSGIPGFVLLFNIYHIWPKPLLLLLMFLSFFFLFLFFLGGGAGAMSRCSLFSLLFRLCSCLIFPLLCHDDTTKPAWSFLQKHIFKICLVLSGQ